MIRRLRLNFIAITMGALLLVFAAILISINVVLQVSSTRATDALLDTIAAQDGESSAARQRVPSPQEAPYAPARDVSYIRIARFFFARLDGEGQSLELSHTQMTDFTDGEAEALVARALETRKARGTLDSLRFLVAEKSYGFMVVFAERAIENHLLRQLVSVSLGVAGFCGVALFVVVWGLSKWAVRPVEEALSRQRRFIADASHELKTPLTVIAANADVLEREIGENRWLSIIQAQTRRMSELVRDLLGLARSDECAARALHTDVNLSQTARNMALSFESRAYEEKKSYEQDIASGIHLLGDEAGLGQVISILIDNAIRHSEPAGQITVTLRREGGAAVLSVYNTGEGVEEAERERLFERFYRGDQSRSRDTGGYGLGLSIAQAIVRSHRGRINVTGEQGRWVRFTVMLPGAEQRGESGT